MRFDYVRSVANATRGIYPPREGYATISVDLEGKEAAGLLQEATNLLAAGERIRLGIRHEPSSQVALRTAGPVQVVTV